MQLVAIKDLLFRLADDKLIIGHRMSEWIGLGPILEEDIAFASMAQDEVGHSQAYFQLLHDLGEDIPDKVAFTRKEEAFTCCQMVEYPIGDYAFSLMRHYLFDMADLLVTNDSGPAHFASMTKTQVLVLFGPETPQLYGPVGERIHIIWKALSCSPCINAINHRFSPCCDNQCMKQITVDEVCAKAMEILAVKQSTIT